MASLLKLYLRELPEPVVPFVFYDSFCTATKCELMVHPPPHTTHSPTFTHYTLTHLHTLHTHPPSHTTHSPTSTHYTLTHLHTLHTRPPSHTTHSPPPHTTHSPTSIHYTLTHLHTLFLCPVYETNKLEALDEVKRLLIQLPKVNFNVLKYLR